MVRFVAGPTTDFSVRLTDALPDEAVTVIEVFGTVGNVYEVEAWPFAAVVAGFGLNVPPAPLSVNETDAPETTFPEEFLAVTTIGFGRVVPTVPLCFAPEVTTMLDTNVEVAFSVKIADV
jgi:hypothetical protein